MASQRTPSRRAATNNKSSPSPSPPPKPPSTSTPGPRASTLQKIYDDAIDRVTRHCSYQDFSACFPTPAEYAPDSLVGLHRDFVTRLGEVCRNEFKALMEERNVVQSLNELDALLADARKRKAVAESANGGADVEPPQPPHLLPPSSLLSAQLAPFINSQTERLNGQLNETLQSNDTLASTIQQQQREIELLVRGLENTVADIEGAAAMLQKSPDLKAAQSDLEREATAPGAAPPT